MDDALQNAKRAEEILHDVIARQHNPPMSPIEATQLMVALTEAVVLLASRPNPHVFET